MPGQAMCLWWTMMLSHGCIELGTAVQEPLLEQHVGPA